MALKRMGKVPSSGVVGRKVGSVRIDPTTKVVLGGFATEPKSIESLTTGGGYLSVAGAQGSGTRELIKNTGKTEFVKSDNPVDPAFPFVSANVTEIVPGTVPEHRTELGGFAVNPSSEKTRTTREERGNTGAAPGDTGAKGDFPYSERAHGPSGTVGAKKKSAPKSKGIIPPEATVGRMEDGTNVLKLPRRNPHEVSLSTAIKVRQPVGPETPGAPYPHTDKVGKKVINASVIDNFLLTTINEMREEDRQLLEGHKRGSRGGSRVARDAVIKSGKSAAQDIRAEYLKTGDAVKRDAALSQLTQVPPISGGERLPAGASETFAAEIDSSFVQPRLKAQKSGEAGQFVIHGPANVETSANLAGLERAVNYKPKDALEARAKDYLVRKLVSTAKGGFNSSSVVDSSPKEIPTSTARLGQDAIAAMRGMFNDPKFLPGVEGSLRAARVRDHFLKTHGTK